MPFTRIEGENNASYETENIVYVTTLSVTHRTHTATDGAGIAYSVQWLVSTRY